MARQYSVAKSRYNPQHGGSLKGKSQLPYYFPKKTRLPFYCKIAIVVPKSGACFAIGVLFPKKTLIAIGAQGENWPSLGRSQKKIRNPDLRSEV